jgi:hypothetical protein
MVKSLFLILPLWLCTIICATSGDLTAKEISAVKQICRALVGTDSGRQSDEIFDRLAPYVRHEMTLLSLHVVCDKRCGGLVNLRGDADIYFSYPNAPDGHSRIDTVVFRKDGKVILSIGNDGGRWKAPPSNQSLEPTAGRRDAHI